MFPTAGAIELLRVDRLVLMPPSLNFESTQYMLMNCEGY